MAEHDPHLSNARSYTEATHTAYADVAGAAFMNAGGRDFVPGRITVKYNWRTQLGDSRWKVGNIEISGRWVDETYPGSGLVILSPLMAPVWARSFAEGHMPTSILVERARA